MRARKRSRAYKRKRNTTRQFRKKKTFSRNKIRSKRPVRKLLLQKGLPFPDSVMIKCKAQTYLPLLIDIDPTDTNSYIFNGNNAFEPNPSNTSMTPSGYSMYSGFFNAATVLSSSIKIDI